MSKKEKYLPLRIADFARRREGSGSVLGTLRERGLVLEGVTLSEYTGFLFGGRFLDPEYRGPFERFNRFAMSPALKARILQSFPAGEFPADMETELKDIFGISAVIETWSTSKQVYKIDGDFFRELLRTENAVIPGSAFSHLPVDTMYLDLSSCPELLPIEGAFVHSVEGRSGRQLVIYMETGEATTFSYYSNFRYGDNGAALFHSASLPSGGFLAIDLTPGKDTRTSARRMENDRRRDIVNAIVQILLYLSAECPDVEESPVTKKSYRPGKEIRNRFAEIRMWDVGVRYGKAITLAEKEIARSREEAAAPPQKGRRSPRPHLRCAHWQRYHVGAGRKELRVNWVPPVIVCGDSAVPVTIHQIENKKSS